MTAEKRGASFNPDEASGGFEKGRVTISGVAVDYITAEKGKNAGQKYVSLKMLFNRQDGGDAIPVSLLIGSAEEWSPNSTKTEAIPSREDGKFWNKSDLVQFMKSLVNAGFPKSRMGSDFSVLNGLDVDVERVKTEGTHKDKEGKERPNTALLVMKIHTSQADLESGAYSKNSGKATGATRTSSKPSTAVKTTSAPAAPAGDLREYAKELVISAVEASGGNGVKKADLQKSAYIAITKAKRGAERNDIIAIINDQAFLDELSGEGLIVDDGEVVQLAA